MLGGRSRVTSVVLRRRTIRNRFFRVSDGAIVFYGLDLVGKVGFQSYLHGLKGRTCLADAQEMKKLKSAKTRLNNANFSILKLLLPTKPRMLNTMDSLKMRKFHF